MWFLNDKLTGIANTQEKSIADQEASPHLALKKNSFKNIWGQRLGFKEHLETARRKVKLLYISKKLLYRTRIPYISD